MIRVNAFLKQKYWEIKNRNKPKVFGIRFNKTGTTSLKKVMLDLNFKVGNQITSEHLLLNWKNEDFDTINNYCKSACFFQDIPFSLPNTFISLDKAYPNSKFILTIRDNSEQWYNSITKSHSKIWGTNGNLPNKIDLENAEYRYKGWAWDVMKYALKSSDENPYQKEKLINIYNSHIQNVIDYFRYRQEDLLILNVSEKEAFSRLMKFLDIEGDIKTFPWENKT